jgi:hypothetical protein
MHKLFYFFLTTLALQLRSQDIQFSYDYDKSDIQDAFRLLGVSNFKYQMPPEYKEYYFDLIIKEYYEGKEISSTNQAKRFANQPRILYWDKTFAEYTMKIQSTKANDSIETFRFRMPQASLSGKLKLKLPRHEYEWETLLDEKTKLTSDTEIPILTFATEPVNDSRPNVAVYCELSQDVNNYKGWYEKFKIKHYYVLCIKVTKELIITANEKTPY